MSITVHSCMSGFALVLASLTCGSLGRRVPFGNNEVSRSLREDSFGSKNKTLKELRLEQTSVDSAKTVRQQALSGRVQALSSLFLFRRRSRPTTGWQTAGNVLASAATSISSSVGNGVVEYLDRRARQRRLQPASHEVLLISLLAARLSEIAYLDSEEELEKELASPAFADAVPGGYKILHFHRQGQNKENEINPQWFLARGALPWWDAEEDEQSTDKDGEALYLVFRGTWSVTDAMRDACIEPESARNGCFHGGFLQAVQDNPDLHTHLRRAMRRGCKHLYVCGHSLGGSVAMALVAADLLPAWYSGDVTAIGIGATACVATAPQTSACAGKASRSRSRPAPRYVLVVNDCDVVPRLLGSPMPLSISRMLAQSVTGASEAVLQRNVELMETIQQYAHPDGTETVLLRDGRAKAVPSSELASVLHFDQAVSTNLFEHHRTGNYISELEIATTLCEVFDHHGSFNRSRRKRKRWR